MKKLAFAIGVMSFLVFSCVTTAYNGLPGAVYDSQGRPLKDVLVSSNYGAKVVTSLSGRYFMPVPLLVEQVFSLTLSKEGFETVTIQFNTNELRDGSIAAYVRMYSQRDLLRKSWEKIEKKQFQKARDLLQRAAAIDTTNELFQKTLKLLDTINPIDKAGTL